MLIYLCMWFDIVDLLAQFWLHIEQTSHHTMTSNRIDQQQLQPEAPAKCMHPMLYKKTMCYMINLFCILCIYYSKYLLYLYRNSVDFYLSRICPLIMIWYCTVITIPSKYYNIILIQSTWIRLPIMWWRGENLTK